MKRLLLLVLLAVSATPSVINDVNKVPDDGDAGEMADVEVNEIPEKVVWDRAELTEEFEEQLLTAVVTPRLSEGIIGPLDTLLYNATHSKPAENGVPYRNIININVRSPISAIRVTPVGSQNLSASIFGGGLGSRVVRIRIRTAVGRGYNLLVQIYGWR